MKNCKTMTGRLTIKEILDAIEQEGKTDLFVTDSQTGYVYLNGFRDGVIWAMEKARQRLPLSLSP